MKLSVKQKNVLVYLTQATGIVFVFSFLTAYFGGRVIGGLSSTETLNSNPNFVFTQALIGILFLALVIITLIVAFFLKQED